LSHQFDELFKPILLIWFDTGVVHRAAALQFDNLSRLLIRGLAKLNFVRREEMMEGEGNKRGRGVGGREEGRNLRRQ